jgi:hypothetical protein
MTSCFNRGRKNIERQSNNTMMTKTT